MKTARLLLLPFSLMYSIVLKIRHMLFDLRVFSGQEPGLPCLIVGNLELGGTGKTPMVDFLVRELNSVIPTGVISRGYGRRTSGFMEVRPELNHEEVGDEPLMLKNRNPEVSFFVCEDRVSGIEFVKNLYPEIELMLADDAFQHRSLRGFGSILCTNYTLPFTENFLLPAGTLRDLKSRAKAASMVVVNKCPVNLSAERMESLRSRILSFGPKEVFFTRIQYGNPVWNIPGAVKGWGTFSNYLIVTGVAKPDSFVEMVQSAIPSAQHIRFSDHHSFSKREVYHLVEKAGPNGCIITTEKDFIRLQYLFPGDENSPALAYIPMEIDFLNSETENFRKSLFQLLTKKFPNLPKR
jgi:tetraacyldisaccharide 4'-kinase